MAYRSALTRLSISCARTFESDLLSRSCLSARGRFSLNQHKQCHTLTRSVCGTAAGQNQRPVTIFGSHSACHGVSLNASKHVRYGSNESGEKSNPRTEVTYSELLDLIKDGNVLLFDVREPKEIEQTGLMPGAVNIPITKLKTSLAMEEEQFQEAYSSPKPSGVGENVLFYGFSNVKSEAALELAHKAGFKKARHFPGGWKEWSEKQQQS